MRRLVPSGALRLQRLTAKNSRPTNSSAGAIARRASRGRGAGPSVRDTLASDLPATARRRRKSTPKTKPAPRRDGPPCAPRHHFTILHLLVLPRTAKKPAWPTTSHGVGRQRVQKLPELREAGPRRAARPAALGAAPVAGVRMRATSKLGYLLYRARATRAGRVSGGIAVSVCNDVTIISTSSCVSAIFEAVCNATKGTRHDDVELPSVPQRSASSETPRPPPSAPDLRSPSLSLPSLLTRCAAPRRGARS